MFYDGKRNWATSARNRRSTCPEARRPSRRSRRPWRKRAEAAMAAERERAEKALLPSATRGQRRRGDPARSLNGEEDAERDRLRRAGRER